MSERELLLAASIAQTLSVLPEAAQQRWLGYAEGVADMARAAKEKNAQETGQKAEENK